MKNLIIIFTKNPELGKAKTRLAASIGNQNALEIYKTLINHTQKAIQNVKAKKYVYYSEKITENDNWNTLHVGKKLQNGNDLGEKMKNAFEEGFAENFEKIVIIGTDLYNLEAKDIETTFDLLSNNDVVIGPATDGGYYLLGLKQIPENIFKNKKWSTNTVLSDTLKNIQHLKYHLLQPKNDIDTLEDIINITEFKKYIP